MSQRLYLGQTKAEYEKHLHEPVRMERATVRCSSFDGGKNRIRNFKTSGWACPTCKGGVKEKIPPMCDGVFTWHESSSEPRESQFFTPAEFLSFEEKKS